MLEIRPCCEHCGKDLPTNATDAMICSFECTYCENCAKVIFKDVCPSCGGNFVPRPIRPKKYKDKFPASNKKTLFPKDLKEIAPHINSLKNVLPENR